jgi:hypothetical protein
MTGPIDVHDDSIQIEDYQTIGSKVEQDAVSFFAHGDA